MQNPYQTTTRQDPCVTPGDGLCFAPIAGLFQTTIHHPGHTGAVTLVNDVLEGTSPELIDRLRRAYHRGIPYKGLLSDAQVLALRRSLIERSGNLKVLMGRGLDLEDARFAKFIVGEHKRISKRNATRTRNGTKLMEDPPAVVKYVGDGMDAMGYVYWPGKLVVINQRLIDARFSDDEYRMLLRGITEAWHTHELVGEEVKLNGVDGMLSKDKCIRPVLMWL